jgi:hypothetical protein
MQSPARAFARGHLYRVDSRADEHRAEFFAVTALAAVTDLPAIGWDDAPGRVVIVGDVDQINNFIQPKIHLLAQAWGVALPDPGRMIFVGRSEPVRELFARLDTLRGEFSGTADLVPSKGPFSLVIIYQMDMLEGPVGITAKGSVVEHPLYVEQCRLLTRLDGNPAVVVGQKPHRQIAHPIIVDELRPGRVEARSDGPAITEIRQCPEAIRARLNKPPKSWATTATCLALVQAALRGCPTRLIAT